MLNPLDLNRLATRIENLERQSTRDWMPGDDLEFKRALPDSDNPSQPWKLPSSTRVRKAAKGEIDLSVDEYRHALQVCLRLEGLIHRNRGGSVQRLMHDIVRGRVPGGRR